MPTEITKDPRFEMLLDYLKRTRGFDFTGYKRSSLMRRVLKRMHAVQVNDFLDYMDFLEVRPDEFMHLFNTILINVTSFFRDESSRSFGNTGCSAARTIAVAPKIVSMRVVNTRIFSSAPRTLKSMYAPSLRPTQSRCRFRTFSGQPLSISFMPSTSSSAYQRRTRGLLLRWWINA